MLVAAAALMAVVAGAPPAPPGSLREQATQAYRRGDLARACPLFQRAARASPTDGEAWSDLGLCLAKQRKKQEALAALDRAISVGDEPARLHAYFNIAASRLRGLVLRGPESPSPDPECSRLPAVQGCSIRWWACSFSYSFTGTSYFRAGSGAFVGPREEAEALARRVLDTATAGEEIEAEFDVTYERRSGEFCGRDCIKYVCNTTSGLPAEALSPAERQRKTQVDTCFDECMKQCQDEEHEVPLDGCTIVSVNPCARAVGIVCREAGELRARELPARRARGG